MEFKNVILSKEEATKWAEYFAEKYPTQGRINRWSTWSGMTVNEDQSVFIEKDRENHDNPNEVEFYYFWYGHLFSLEMKQIWGEEDLEAWEFNRIIPYPYTNLGPGIHLPIHLENKEEKIFQDLKQAMITYGRNGGIVLEGYEHLDPPIPNITLQVEGRVY